MRIFFFVRRYPVPYKTYYDTQFADLVSRGHEVTIFAAGTHDRTVNEKVIRYGLVDRTAYFPGTRRTLPRYVINAAGALATQPRRVLALIRRGFEQRLDDPLIHAGRILTILRQAHEKPDLCFIHGLGTATMLPWLRRVFVGTPVAMYYHGGEVPTSNDFEQIETAAAFRAVDLVFTNTRFSRQHAIERGCSPDRITVLPVGFDLSDFVPAQHRRYRPGGRLRLLSAGRMSEEKGVAFALRALKQLVDGGVHDIHYSLTGEGYQRPALEQFVRGHGLETYVSFLGTLTTEGVIRAMGEADALVLPSIQVGNWVENQACAVQEAMLMKAVVVVSRTGGVPESIPTDMLPYVTDPGSVESLAEAFLRLRAQPVSELARLGEIGRAFVVDNYDIARLNDELIARSLAARLSGPDMNMAEDRLPAVRAG